MVASCFHVVCWPEAGQPREEPNAPLLGGDSPERRFGLRAPETSSVSSFFTHLGILPFGSKILRAGSPNPPLPFGPLFGSLHPLNGEPGGGSTEFLPLARQLSTILINTWLAKSRIERTMMKI